MLVIKLVAILSFRHSIILMQSNVCDNLYMVLKTTVEVVQKYSKCLETCVYRSTNTQHMHVNAAEREAVALPNILQYCWTPSTALNAVMILSDHLESVCNS